MTASDLAALYRAYIACLNARDWPGLSRFVHPEASHNERPIGLDGYRALLEQDVAEIPDLQFGIALLACEPPMVAARLAFDCTPQGDFLNLPVRGRRVRFTENVFYEYRDGKIWRVSSIIDKAAIEAQLPAG